MTFGRPAAIPDCYVRLELPVEYELADASVTTFEARKEISVGFYSATMFVLPNLTRGSMLIRVGQDRFTR